jgi:rubrerythrin
MSRNEERLGLDNAPAQDNTPAATTAAVGIGAPAGDTAPAFSWSVPTEFVELPSEGLFYPPGHPLHEQKTVEIRFMTAKEEDILTSRSLLKAGVALDRMLQNILIDKRINVNSLLVGDKNALLVAARRTGYGPEYVTKVNCPSCGTSTEHSFDISEPPVNSFKQNAQDLGVLYSNNGTVTITLPMSGVTVECRLLTGDDENRLIKETERKSKRKLQSSTTTDAFRAFIVSVNGDSNTFSVESFIQSMPARDARHLRTIYNEVLPNIDLKQEFVCTECGHEADMEVPLGVDFFWPK